MQVDPIKPTLKAPGTKRLKLQYDEPLSSFAFKFNLRRYNQGFQDVLRILRGPQCLGRLHWVGRCRLTLWNPS